MENVHRSDEQLKKDGHTRIVRLNGDQRASGAGIEITEGGRSSEPTVFMREEEVAIGCTVVSRGVVEKLAEAFKEHFPVGTVRRVKLQ